MRISARDACVKPHLRTRSDIKNIMCIFIVDIQKSKLDFQYNLFEQNIVYAFAIVLAIFGKSCIRHILCGHSKIVLKIDLNNISDGLRNILAILQYFQRIFLQYCLNISVQLQIFRCNCKYSRGAKGNQILNCFLVLSLSRN